MSVQDNLPSIKTVTKVAVDLADPSTYAGLGAVALALGHALPPSFGVYTTALSAIFGGIAAFLVKKHNIDPGSVGLPEPKV